MQVFEAMQVRTSHIRSLSMLMRERKMEPRGQLGLAMTTAKAAHACTPPLQGTTSRILPGPACQGTSHTQWLKGGSSPVAALVLLLAAHPPPPHLGRMHTSHLPPKPVPPPPHQPGGQTTHLLLSSMSTSGTRARSTAEL
jgi:hypothetical protein